MGKQGRSVCRSCYPWSPTLTVSLFFFIHYSRQKTKQKKQSHTCHALTHTQIIKCPNHNIPETISNCCHRTNETPTYSSDRLMQVSFHFFFCYIFNVRYTNYASIFPEHSRSALFVAVITVW